MGVTSAIYIIHISSCFLTETLQKLKAKQTKGKITTTKKNLSRITLDTYVSFFNRSEKLFLMSCVVSITEGFSHQLPFYLKDSFQNVSNKYYPRLFSPVSARVTRKRKINKIQNCLAVSTKVIISWNQLSQTQFRYLFEGEKKDFYFYSHDQLKLVNHTSLYSYFT